MKSISAFIVSVILQLYCLRFSQAFLVPAPRTLTSSARTNAPRRTRTGISLLSTNSDENDKNNINRDTNDSSDGKLNRFKNLLGRLLVKDTSSSASEEEDHSPATAVKPLLVVEKDLEKNDTTEESVEPMEQAKRLRSAAEKARLEAERMDVELTLEKISRLEKELTKPKADVETLQKQLESLQRKLTQSSPSSSSSSSKEETAHAAPPSITTSETRTEQQDDGQNDTLREFSSTELSKIVEPLDEEALKLEIERLERTPKFLLKTLAMAVGEPADDNGIYNATEVALKLDQIKRYDFSNSPKATPVFSAAQIQAKEEEIKEEAFWANLSPLKEKAGGNSTKFALLLLEFEYYTNDIVSGAEGADNMFDKFAENSEWLQLFNKSRVDSGIETLYPACTRRSPIPTEAEMERFMKQVLPKTDFVSSGAYQKVESGYIIRGNPKRDDANVIESIDRALGPLAEKMTVLYTPDFTVFIDEEVISDDPLFDLNSLAPILYVVGPEVTREPKPIQLGITSSLGLATSWYLSIYPFLLNTGIAKRVDEDLALVDAGLQPDLLWLTDLSVPMFASFMSILLAHEMGHIIAAGVHKFKSSVPTFVPSFITGVTSTVTTFRTLPPTKNAMFDFGLAGPALGILASIVALVVGSQLTLSGDPTNFPALPLAILRQSTLGGGIIDYILGGGTLYVPEGALGTSAVAEMTIPLHPIALAGYIGLVVNALSLLPIGTTDGGRLALALFGRPAKLAVGNITMLSLLIAGVLGSDLFLFYFAFCLAFQSGNEVPARNEVDKVDLTRVFAATGAYMVVLLALIPFQM